MAAIMKPNDPAPIKLKVYYQELLVTAISTTPIFLTKETTIEVPFSVNPMSVFIRNANHDGFVFLEKGKPVMFHNILHVTIAQ